MALNPPSGPEGFLTTFKDLAPMFALGEAADEGSIKTQARLVDIVEQQDYEYDVVKTLPTLINNMVSLDNNIKSGKTNLVNGVTNYLTTVLASHINTTATTASGVLAGLVQIMQGSTDGTPSGVYVLSGGRFHTFVYDTYGIHLPFASGAVYLNVHEARQIYSGTIPSTRRLIPDTTYPEFAEYPAFEL